MSDAVSVIVPTYKEAESLPLLIDHLEQLMHKEALKLELLIMDDDSQDGTEELIKKLSKPWIRLVIRKKERGLSPAVVEGLSLATHANIVVMDADLSHPPATIPMMIQALNGPYDFVVGSRYVAGATTDETWGFFRKLNSFGATLLAYPFTHGIKDPMSGYFAIKRETLNNAKQLNPIGYKIGLELYVKCDCKKPLEIPIHFANRQFGSSKLSLAQQWLYIKHLRRLFLYKYAEQSYIVQFLVVGCCGVVINLAVLTLLLWFGLSPHPAIAGGIVTALVGNFLLNRRITFSYARNRLWWRQFLGFASASSVGAIINYFSAVELINAFALFAHYPQLAALCGIIAGTGFNYILNRYFVFSKD